MEATLLSNGIAVLDWAWVSLSISCAAGSSVDGIMVVAANSHVIRTKRDLFRWSLAITIFHAMFQGLAGVLTLGEVPGNTPLQATVRLVGFAATAYFGWKAVAELVWPVDLQPTLSTTEFFSITAVFGSADAFSFGHVVSLDLAGYPMWSIWLNWLVVSIGVGLLTAICGGILAAIVSFSNRSFPRAALFGGAVRVLIFAILLALLGHWLYQDLLKIYLA